MDTKLRFSAFDPRVTIPIQTGLNAAEQEFSHPALLC